MYYNGKLNILKDIFGAEDILLENRTLSVGDMKYPIIDDVIVLSKPSKYTDTVRKHLGIAGNNSKNDGFAKDIQSTFGDEWRQHNKILREHREEFEQYFDIINIDKLKDSRVCDLGCGNGRWSYYLRKKAKEIILVDFSDAIFVARKNLSGNDNCLFFMCDLKELPFKDDFADLIFCLGVLHHLSTPALEEVRNLKRFAPSLLIYLYYSLDNKPVYFRLILRVVTFLRLKLCGIRHPLFRKIFSSFGAIFIYIPLIFLGRLLALFGLGRLIPLYEIYHGKSLKRIEQDVYDRFFTRIEQRASKKELLDLKKTFPDVTISSNMPYWHFLCKR